MMKGWKDRFAHIRHKELLIFVAKTAFYFLVILALLYFYSYSRTGGAHFIYNDF